jgi:hypothetical protein
MKELASRPSAVPVSSKGKKKKSGLLQSVMANLETIPVCAEDLPLMLAMVTGSPFMQRIPY